MGRPTPTADGAVDRSDHGRPSERCPADHRRGASSRVPPSRTRAPRTGPRQRPMDRCFRSSHRCAAPHRRRCVRPRPESRSPPIAATGGALRGDIRGCALVPVAVRHLRARDRTPRSRDLHPPTGTGSGEGLDRRPLRSVRSGARRSRMLSSRLHREGRLLKIDLGRPAGRARRASAGLALRLSSGGGTLAH